MTDTPPAKAMPMTVHFDAGMGQIPCHAHATAILFRDRIPTATTCGNCTRTRLFKRRLQVVDLEELLER